MKKEWQTPKIVNIQIKKITLSGSLGNAEQNSGQGSTSKRR